MLFQVLCRALSIIESLKLNSIVCVFDQAIYCKACEIKWKEPAKFKNCVLMMGMFHMVMTYMHILSKRFSGAGLKDALIQSGVVAEGSVDAALRGKSYNRGVRLYKLFYEALQHLLIKKLDNCIGCHREELFDQFDELDREVHEEFHQSQAFQSIFNPYLDLRIALNKSTFTLQKFWMSFIEMTELLINIIYACQAGMWDLLLECIREVIPFAFAYDHINYARYLSVMHGEMLSLETDFPEIYNQCYQGNFRGSVDRGSIQQSGNR